MLATVGCSNHEISKIKPIVNSFKCDFTVFDSPLCGTISVDRKGNVTMVFSSPDDIAGFGLTVQSDGVIIEASGITEKYAINEVPNDSPAIKIYKSLKSAVNLTPTESDSEIYVENSDFKAVLNGTGFITKLLFKGTELTVNLQNHIEIK